MKQILSTGNAFTIAAAAGDAGQLGMVAGFDGFLKDRISLRLSSDLGSGLGDICGDDRLTSGLGGGALRGDRLGATLALWFKPCLESWGWLTEGDRLVERAFYPRTSRRYLHFFTQHFVSRH
ncbi:MAG: hypothetical protein WBA99_19840 [Nodosilinea sp.]